MLNTETEEETGNLSVQLYIEIKAWLQKYNINWCMNEQTRTLSFSDRRWNRKLFAFVKKTQAEELKSIKCVDEIRYEWAHRYNVNVNVNRYVCVCAYEKFQHISRNFYQW